MIVYHCADLIFATKVRSTAESLDIVTRPVRDADRLRNRLDQVDDGKANDPVTGVIIDLETGQTGLDMIEQVKQHDAAVPIVAFGPHVEVEALAAAEQRGADVVMPRGAFNAQLPAILKQLAGPESQ